MPRIAFSNSVVEAGQIQALLESEGFHPMPINSSAHVTVAGAEQGYHVEIPAAEAEAASALLERAGFGQCLAE